MERRKARDNEDDRDVVIDGVHDESASNTAGGPVCRTSGEQGMTKASRLRQGLIIN